MTHAEFLQWCRYEAWEERRNTKYDWYLARITAYMAAQCNPKGRYNADQFLVNRDDDVPAGHKDLRKMSSDEVKAMFRSIPGATYTEASDG